jgi:diguanylate cyclase (GGDEF)-like protein
MGADQSTAELAAIAFGTLMLAAVANGVAAGTIMLRERLSPVALIEILVRSVGGITLAEIGLAWVFVTLFTTAAWWAPLALAVIVLLVWPREGVEFIDPLMKLPRDRMFRRELDGALARTRRGLATGGLLLLLDLDGFGQLNKYFGQHGGDEVLAEVGDRLRALIRATDFAGRRGGDELAMFYAGVVDLPTARRLAARVEAAIRRPYATPRGGPRRRLDRALIIRPARDPVHGDAHAVGGRRGPDREAAAEGRACEIGGPLPRLRQCAWAAAGDGRRDSGDRRAGVRRHRPCHATPRSRHAAGGAGVHPRAGGLDAVAGRRRLSPRHRRATGC